MGTIIFKLFDNIAPAACRNFRELATGKPGFGYEGSNFFRIVPDFIIQGGNIETVERDGRPSIYDHAYPGGHFINCVNHKL
jgi:peptidylprolyl isomerase